eukprot:snap_masked-scaffold_14-processed-gene-0.14-mRNA-1 protein AED:1.00 eAED:1.00 QI:0/0/0/0/1/1/2/0/59
MINKYNTYIFVTKSSSNTVLTPTIYFALKKTFEPYVLSGHLIIMSTLNSKKAEFKGPFH